MLLAGVGLCVLVLAFTSAVDASFTSISRHRLSFLLSEGGPHTRRAVSRLINDPYRFKSTIIFLNIAATIAVTALTLHLTAGFQLWQQLGWLGVLMLALLIFSEAIPKALAIRNPDTTAMLLAGPLRTISQLIWPLIALVNLITSPLFRHLNGGTSYPSPLVTEEELRMLVNVGEEEGLIEHDEREMIEGVIAFGNTLLREIMVPRVDIVAIEVDTALDKALDVVVAGGHSRIPVYNETINQIVGILYAKDLIPALRDGERDMPISSLLRPAHFVPETMRVNALLEDLQQRKVHMAIMVDEYGNTAGLATIEDLIEQIVGEIQDEYDTEDPSIQPFGNGEYVIDGRVPIDDVNYLADLDLSSDSADRIGGLVSELLGRVPKVGDELLLDRATLTVLSVKGVRPQKLRILRQRPVTESDRPRDKAEDGAIYEPT
ncbi:MAG: HlyC/CorC family transporter [Oscillochloris sp.]|nr:HlyC/CorC family transporter [Oscillochloris sp.]